MTKIEELENVLFNQIEMLNDESLNDTPETAKWLRNTRKL